MMHEKSCGAIVYRKYHGNTEILLIKHINSGHWSFPKGHVEEGETEEETAKREIMEETGIDVNLDTTFREIQKRIHRKMWSTLSAERRIPIITPRRTR